MFPDGGLLYVVLNLIMISSGTYSSEYVILYCLNVSCFTAQMLHSSVIQLLNLLLPKC